MANAVDVLQLDPLTEDPTTPVDGMVWLNVTEGKIKTHLAGVTTIIATLGSAGSGGLIQTKYAEQAVDTQMTSTSYQELLSVQITVQAGSSLVVHATGSFSNSSNGTYGRMQIRLDGNPVRGTAFYTGNSSYAGAGAITVQIPSLAAGTYTVALMWSRSGGTLRCRPASNPDEEHASLLVEEVIS